MAPPETKAPTKKAFHFPKTARSAKEKTRESAQSAKSNTRSDEPTDATLPEANAAAGGLSAKSSTGAKSKRPKKDKVVRDSFTMPKSDHARIAALKQKCLANGLRVKKSELLRAGLLMLDSTPIKKLVATIGTMESVKARRPAKS